MVIKSVLALAIAYILGAIPFGLIFVRATTGKDIRQLGSGRTGGTNVLRAAGPLVAFLSILCDFAKGWGAVKIARLLTGIPALEAASGLIAVVGHNYSIFIGFKGGAGTMTTIGGALGLWPLSCAIAVVVGGVAILLTRHASVGSIVVAVLLPLLFAWRASLGRLPWSYMIHSLGTTALTLWSLRPNIRRLLAGSERKVTLHRSR
ncbi:MAG: glycerol-3-phosphate acyltransferase [Anaerolineae bacterium]|nr:glycerol-3-phosphate acyltransferase [Anaerolineae bacterium]